MQSVTGGLLVINHGVLDAVDLGPDSDVAVLVAQVHIDNDGVNKQVDIIGAFHELKSLNWLLTKEGISYLISVIKFYTKFTHFILVIASQILELSNSLRFGSIKNLLNQIQ